MEKARKDAEQQLEEQRARAVVSERLSALGEMATGMAHELNQPLSGVRGLAEHILIGFDRGWDLSKKTIRENVQMIIEQTERMTHVIEHTRKFARGVESPDLLPVQINDVIRSAQDLIEFHLQYRGLKLKCDLAEGLPFILANPFSLEEVILNLINNARDALSEYKKTGHSNNSQEITIRTLQELKDSKCTVKIQVIDNGAGIHQDLMSKIFNPFFTTKDPDKGTGLGLAISKSIIEEFKGTITINSIPGRGTTVTIILPVMT
jgi:histidine kinase